MVDSFVAELAEDLELDKCLKETKSLLGVQVMQSDELRVNGVDVCAARGAKIGLGSILSCCLAEVVVDELAHALKQKPKLGDHAAVIPVER